MPSPFVSIVIPVLQDREVLRETLASIARVLSPPQAAGDKGEAARPVEIVVVGVAGESADLETLCAGDPRVRVVEAPPGRARQMNAGARAASGRWLLFLHADSRPDRGWLRAIARADVARAAWGCFRFALDEPSRPARLVEWWVRHRVRFARLPYGDQGIFVRRDLFERIGGYAPLPLMEDVELVRRLRRAGRMYVSAVPVTTSARRWRRDGWVRRSVSNNTLLGLYTLGASPAWLARRYGRRKALAVVVLARAPVAGGKSRLWRELGTDPDPRLLRALLLDTLAAVRSRMNRDVFVAVTPPDQRAEIAHLVPDATVIAQRGDDLGARMHAAFDDLFGFGYRAVLLIGSDLPSLPAAALDDAFRRLARRRTDVVFGPAEDGGYWLVGLKRPEPALFAGVTWGAADVLQQTLDRAGRAGLSSALVARWYDVDDVASLRRAAGDSERAPRTHAWWTVTDRSEP